MFFKYFNIDSGWSDESYRHRGRWRRTVRNMKKMANEFRLENKRRAAMPIPQEYFDHIGGYIEVVTYGFGENVSEFGEFYQYGYLTEIDVESKYVRWTSHGHTMPPVHIDNIKLLK